MVGNRIEDNHNMEKAFITRFVSLTLQKLRKLTNSSRSIAMIDAHGYDYSHILIVVCHLWYSIGVYCCTMRCIASSYRRGVLKLLVLTNWAIPKALKGGASNG